MKAKTTSITNTAYIKFIPSTNDIEPLAFFERELMKKRHCTDSTEVNNAEILRHIIHELYDVRKKKRMG